MIRINQLKLPIQHQPDDLKKKAAKLLRIRPEAIRSVHILKQSVDARKKEDILFIYTVEVETDREEAVVKKAKHGDVSIVEDRPYVFPNAGGGKLKNRPVIAGSGPAGMFCGYMLAMAGYEPVILERGDNVEIRTKKVEEFWNGGVLDINSNVQFGEGGAGTFSDGKLNTLVKDPLKRNRKVLEIFAEHGAGQEILYQNKPHIGTDVLSQVVLRMREHIEQLGGRVLFNSQVTDIVLEETDGEKHLAGVVVNGTERMETQAFVLAVGHSARDTFEMLLERGVPMRQKAFAVGLRIQHNQEMINLAQYGTARPEILGAASYKLTKQTSSGRGVYSFCMCPGGFVVNASSENGCLAVNGMSNHDRGGKNANSALIVTVTPEDFDSDSPLAGVEYQRMLEQLAYRYGNGRIPVQLYGDFKEGTLSGAFGDVVPEFKGLYQFANLKEMLPPYLSEALIEGIEGFELMIKGFGRSDSILAGIESRTSSPVRIERGQNFESVIKGLFPCGEGAGYAGGITSAAMDGIKAAEEIASRYQPFRKLTNA